MYQRLLLLFVVLAIATALACNDKPPQPKPVEYNIYYGNNEQGDLYVLDAKSLTIIDSIPGIGPPYSMAVSPDGAWLYAVPWIRPDPPYLKKIDTRTNIVVDSLGDDRFNALTLLDRGKILIRGSQNCRGEVIEPHTLEHVRMINDSICPIRGPIGGTKVAALVDGGLGDLLHPVGNLLGRRLGVAADVIGCFR